MKSHGAAEALRVQTLVALGDYRQAARAAPRALLLLPPDHLGEVVVNRADYYLDAAEYTRQLRALEGHLHRAPADADARLLLGFQYGYLGYPEDAVNQLQQSIDLAPPQPAAKRLLDYFLSKIEEREQPAPQRDGIREF